MTARALPFLPPFAFGALMSSGGLLGRGPGEGRQQDF